MGAKTIKRGILMAIPSDDKDAIELIKRIDIIFRFASDMEFRQKVIEIMRNKTYNEYDKQLHSFLLQELQSRRPNDAKIIPQILHRELSYFNPLTKPVVRIPPKPIHESNVQHKEKAKKTPHARLGLFGNMNAKENTSEANQKSQLTKKAPTQKRR